MQLKYILFYLFLFQSLTAQILLAGLPKEHIAFSISSTPDKIRPQEHGRILVKANLQEGWYLYSIEPIEEEIAPLPTKLSLKLEGESIAEGVFYESQALVKDSDLFEVPLGYHTRKAIFYHNFRIPKNPTTTQNQVTVTVKYQTCSDKICLPPKTVTLRHSFSIENKAVRSEFSQPRYDVEFIRPDFKWSWDIVQFLILAFLSGLLALLNPCVFPMFPITIGYFNKKHKSGLWQSISLFAIGMIGAYVLVGVGVSSLMGANTISDIASHPVTNLAISFLFIWFALVLLGYQTQNRFSLGQHLEGLANRIWSQGESVSWELCLWEFPSP